MLLRRAGSAGVREGVRGTRPVARVSWLSLGWRRWTPSLLDYVAGSRIVQAAGRHEFRRHLRRRLQFQGQHLRHPSRADAADGVRPRRQFHPRLRRRPVRPAARAAHRRATTTSGRPMSPAHRGLQVQSRRAAGDGARRARAAPGEWHDFGHLRLFNEPNEAVVGPTGDMFVLQGHGKGESLVLKFDTRRQLHQDLGQEGQGAGRVRPAAFAGVRRQGAALHRRPQQRAHPGVRRRRQLHPRVEAPRHAVRAVHGARPDDLAGARPHRPDHDARSQRQRAGRDGRARARARRSASTARRITSRSARAARCSSPTR